MRYLQFASALFAAVFSVQLLAESAVSKDRVKTGILPSGKFYSIYQVNCLDKTQTHIAMMDRRRTWCTVDGLELDCYRQPQEAAARACAEDELIGLNAQSGISPRSILANAP